MSELNDIGQPTTIKIFVKLDESGKSQGFYPTDIFEEDLIPAGAIEISRDIWQEYLSNQAGYKFSTEGSLVVIPPPTPEELEERERNQPLTAMELLGRQLVERDLENLTLKSDNKILGQQLVNIELKLLTGGA